MLMKQILLFLFLSFLCPFSLPISSNVLIYVELTVVVHHA